MDQTQLLQFLKAHQQNSAQGVQAAQSMLPSTSLQAMPRSAQPQANAGSPPGSPSFLGFLGGLGDGTTSQGDVDPSWISSFNQSLMKQMGQGSGAQPLPWMQGAGQQLGQNVSSMGSNLGGSLLKLLGIL